MKTKVHTYPIMIKEGYLDFYGHVNNALYLTLFEEARWDLITGNGYGAEKIVAAGLGPVILEASLKFLKELRLRDKIIIESQALSYEGKIAKMTQKMLRGDEVCCSAEFTFGLFDLKQRKLVLPTPEWLKGIGVEDEG
jgi:acyl-CoA thioester hydrolase